jgi:hypothetical protein
VNDRSVNKHSDHYKSIWIPRCRSSGTLGRKTSHTTCLTAAGTWSITNRSGTTGGSILCSGHDTSFDHTHGCEYVCEGVCVCLSVSVCLFACVCANVCVWVCVCLCVRSFDCAFPCDCVPVFLRSCVSVFLFVVVCVHD